MQVVQTNYLCYLNTLQNCHNYILKKNDAINIFIGDDNKIVTNKQSVTSFLTYA